MNRSVLPNQDTAAMADTMVDVANRYYRYPAARALLPLCMKLPITPNQITYTHIACGIAAAGAVASGSPRGLILAFVLTELRAILDCLDGVVARAKGISSPFGRALDELGDAISFIALCVGLYLHLRARNPDFPSGTAILALFVLTALMTGAGDFYRRRFSSALRTGTDNVTAELVIKFRRYSEGDRTFLTAFGIWFDWCQLRILVGTAEIERIRNLAKGRKSVDELAAERTPEVDYILAQAHGPGRRSLSAILTLISLMFGDVVITILALSLLAGDPARGVLVAFVYTLFTFALGLFACSQYLAEARRIDQSRSQSTPPST